MNQKTFTDARVMSTNVEFPEKIYARELYKGFTEPGHGSQWAAAEIASKIQTYYHRIENDGIRQRWFDFVFAVRRRVEKLRRGARDLKSLSLKFVVPSTTPPPHTQKKSWGLGKI